MSLADELLAEVFFTPCALPVSGGLAASSDGLSTRCALPVRGSNRSFQFNAPYFIRTLGPPQLGHGWNTFCGLLRRHGLPLFSGVGPLHDVPAAAVPARWSRHLINGPLDAVELHSADAFEIVCCDSAERNWQWSSELRPSQIGGLVGAVRLAAGGDTPIGIGLPLACHHDDMQRVLDAQVDFIHLYALSDRLEAHELYGLVQFRRFIDTGSAAGLPILVSAPVSEITQAHKLLALGASAICIDTLLQPLLPALPTTPASEVSGSGMLSGLMPSTPRKALPLTAVDAAMGEYVQQLITLLQSIGAPHLQQLSLARLRSCTERAARITGAALINPLAFP